MKAAMMGCFALLLLASGSSAASVTPVEKVIQLMNGMMEKSKKEKHEEEVEFAAYKQFCGDTSTEKTSAIAEANEMIEVLKADIEKYAADIEKYSTEIAEHEEEISTWEGELKAATKVRETEKAAYDVTHKDMTESISALERAVATLKQGPGSKAQAFSQLSSLQQSNKVPDDSKAVISSYLQAGMDEMSGLDQSLEAAAPEANAFESSSGPIIEMLSKLTDTYLDERTALEKAEMNQKQAYDMLAMDLQSQIDLATTDKDEKTAAKAKAGQNKATAEADLQDTTETRDADTKYLKDLTATCQEKETTFQERQQLRAEEIEALEKAIEIISSGEVAGAAGKHLPSMLDETMSASFAQLRSEIRSPIQMQVASYLQDQASKSNSRLLAAVASKLGEDPFVKIKKMIKDLIIKLMEEAAEEAEAKGWCDTELSTNEQTRKEKTESVETLHAEIDELNASIAKLTEDITSLSESVAALDAAMSKATKLREDEKAKNTATIKDAVAAQDAVAKALKVLKDFYAKAGAASFLQVSAKEDGPAQDSSGAVGMLEVIESDFARLETDTKAAEETAQKDYDSFMGDSKVDKAQKATEIDHKSAKKQDQEQTLTQKKKDLTGTQKELDAALAYFDKLKPQCIDKGESYEERVARREEEIQSLQEALKMLSGDSI